ncbi:MAG TPA: DUF547 domain-containing protein [Cyclobacteriaceae bacterium]
MKKWFTLVLIISISGVSKAYDLADFTKSADSFLKKYVNSGSVAYTKIKTHRAEIDELYNNIGKVSLADADSQFKRAFYINAYNLIVIYSIVQHYPVKSPMDIEGFFDKKDHLVAGEQLTLNKLEKDKLISTYKDARLHFVLVCAAKSCPPLLNGAFTKENVEDQLEQRTKITVNNGRWLRVDSKQKRVELSKIFEWYSSDFTTDGKSVLNWINRFRTTKIPIDYQVAYYEYEWALNE